MSINPVGTVRNNPHIKAPPPVLSLNIDPTARSEYKKAPMIGLTITNCPARTRNDLLRTVAATVVGDARSTML